MLRLTILATALLASSTVAPREEIAFAPVPGLRVEKQFTTTSELVLDGASLVMDGEHSDVPLTLRTNATTTLAVRDEFAEVAGGRALRLEREYDRVDGRASTVSRTDTTGGGEIEVASSSKLQGRAVRFEWDGAAERYSRRFADKEAPPDEAELALLKGLDEDLDVRAWLPSRAVAIGDRWQIEPRALTSALSPGGRLGLAPNDPEQAATLARMGGASGLAGLLGTPIGAIEGRLVSIDGAPGDRRARIEFELDVRFDQSVPVDAWPAFLDPSPPGEAPVSARLTATRIDALLDRGRAELVWCVDAGHFESFTLEARLDVALQQTLVLSLGEQALEVQVALEFTLEHRLDASCGRR